MNCEDCGVAIIVKKDSRGFPCEICNCCMFCGEDATQEGGCTCRKQIVELAERIDVERRVHQDNQMRFT